MAGLSLANQLQAPAEYEKLYCIEKGKTAAPLPREFTICSAVSEAVKRKTSITDAPVFTPMDTKKHLLKSYSLSHVEPYINMQILIGHHLGVKGKIANLL